MIDRITIIQEAEPGLCYLCSETVYLLALVDRIQRVLLNVLWLTLLTRPTFLSNITFAASSFIYLHLSSPH